MFSVQQDWALSICMSRAQEREGSSTSDSEESTKERRSEKRSTAGRTEAKQSGSTTGPEKDRQGFCFDSRRSTTRRSAGGRYCIC